MYVVGYVGQCHHKCTPPPRRIWPRSWELTEFNGSSLSKGTSMTEFSQRSDHYFSRDEPNSEKSHVSDCRRILQNIPISWSRGGQSVPPCL